MRSGRRPGEVRKEHAVATTEEGLGTLTGLEEERRVREAWVAIDCLCGLSPREPFVWVRGDDEKISMNGWWWWWWEVKKLPFNNRKNLDMTKD